MFILGIITGLLLAILTLLISLYYRKEITKQLKIIEKYEKDHKGYILEPEDELQEKREEIIKRNKKQGRDTKISELL